jgi:isopenicillin-N N-acyltransferase-like protein
MFGAWGKSLQDKNGLVTMRGLDWSVDGPFKEFHELTVYHNNDEYVMVHFNSHLCLHLLLRVLFLVDSTENTFLNIGWTGWVGSIT